MGEQRTVADLLAEFLAARGVRRAYGVTGGEMLTVLDALRRRGIEFIPTHHEAPAAYMADTEGQLTGRPGLCLSTLGPGAANLLAGLAQATLERSPVIGITADVSAAERAAQTHQVIDITGAMGAVVKFSARIDAENMLRIAPAAWAAATQGRPGAAHLAIPASIAAQPAAQGDWIEPAPEAQLALDAAALEALRDELAVAERPVAVIGLEARSAPVAGAFRELVELFDMPVVTQIKAKGWFAGNHPLHAGSAASYGSRGVFELLRAADLVLGVGLDGVDLIWPWPDVEVVRLTQRPDDDGAFPSRTIRSPLEPALQLLADAPPPTRSVAGAERALQARRAARADLTGRSEGNEAPFAAPRDGLAINHVFAGLRAALDARVALISDVGFHKLYLAQYWDAPGPDSYLVANGLSAMGWALPSSLVYKLERPERPVLAVAGDGSLLMYAGEMETLARLAPAGLVYLVLNDASMSLIRSKADDMRIDAAPNDFGAVDYVGLARSFGLEAARAATPDQAVELVSAGLRRDAPVVVEVPIAYGPYRRML